MKNSCKSPFIDNEDHRRKRTAPLPIVSENIVHTIVSPSPNNWLSSTSRFLYLENHSSNAVVVELKRRRICCGEQTSCNRLNGNFQIDSCCNEISQPEKYSLESVQGSEEIIMMETGVTNLAAADILQQSSTNKSDITRSIWWKTPTLKSFDLSDQTVQCCAICLFSENYFALTTPQNSATTSARYGQHKQQSLLHYFSSSASSSGLFVQRQQPSRYFQPSILSAVSSEEPIVMQPKPLTTCTYCDRTVCGLSLSSTSKNCSIICQQCSKIFCSTSCSIINYSKSFERVYCLDCHERILMEEDSAALQEKRSTMNKNLSEDDVMMLE